VLGWWSDNITYLSTLLNEEVHMPLDPVEIKVDESKRFMITFADKPACCCDTPEEVGAFLNKYGIRFAYMKVFDKGVEMFSKMYLKYP
jgi:hypothetical protein